MIRFNVAYCPCCTYRLDYNKLGGYFWCECDGWSRLKWADRQKELDSAERFDSRHSRLLVSEVLNNGKI